MQARKVGRWCVRLAVVSAVGAIAFSQTPIAGAAVQSGINVVTDLSGLVVPDKTSTSDPTARTEDFTWG